MRHFSLLALSLIAAIAASCNPKEEPKPKETQEIKVSESSKNALVQPSISADATKAESITFTAVEAWHIEVSEGVKAGNDVNWINVTPSSGTAGTYTLSITLQENKEAEPRKATISIVCGSSKEDISITQLNSEDVKPAIVIDEASRKNLVQSSIPADATKAESVSFSVNGPWHADVSPVTKADADWLQVSPSSGQAGSFTLDITLSNNADTEPRSATIKLVCGTASEEISITQLGAVPSEPTCGIVKSLKIAGDDEVEEISYQYDSEGRVSVLTIGHRYGDDFDSMTWNVKYQDGSATISFGDYSIIYSLDAQGRPVKVDDGDEDSIGFEYDEQGHLTRVGGTYTSEGEVPAYLLYAGGALVGATTNKSAIASETQRCSKYLDVVYPNRYSVMNCNIDLNMAMLYSGWVSPFGVEFSGMHYAGDYLMECPFALALEVMLDGSDEDDISEVLTPGKWTFNDKSWPVSFKWQNGSMKYSVEVVYY